MAAKQKAAEEAMAKKKAAALAVLDPTTLSASAEFEGVCVGLFAMGADADAPKQMAVCRKTPDDKCPAFFDSSRCTLLAPVSADVSVGAKMLKF